MLKAIAKAEQLLTQCEEAEAACIDARRAHQQAYGAEYAQALCPTLKERGIIAATATADLYAAYKKAESHARVLRHRVALAIAHAHAVLRADANEKETDNA